MDRALPLVSMTGICIVLAIEVLKSHVAALPPNVFGTWMDVSGSILANWWKRSADQPNF